MKKIFVAAIAGLMSFFSAQAQDNEKALVINAGHARHLVLGNNLNIVLLEHSSGPQEVRLSEAVYDQLQVSMHNETISVQAARFNSSEPVYILVGDFKSITLGENTNVNTEGVLNSAKIDVFVAQGAKALLRTTGKINATSMGDFDVSVERNTPGVAKAF